MIVMMMAAQDAAVATQVASVPAVGMAVKGPDGIEVGKVTQADANMVVIDTGSTKVAFPPSSFAVQDGALLFGMTKAQVDEAAAKAQAEGRAKMAALLVPGTRIVDAQGAEVGTIDGVDGDYAVVSTGKVKARLPSAAFAVSGQSLVLGMTRAQLEAAASGH